MKNIILTALVGLSFSATAAVKYENCKSTEEYVKTLQFLRKQTQYGISDKNAQTLAAEVSKNCTGASNRFLKVLKLLSSVGIDSKTSIDYAQTASKKSKEQTEAFIRVYKDSFKESVYDLDAISALKLASAITFEYEGKIEIAIKDFTKLRDYCMSNKGPNLDMGTCSQLSTYVAKQSEKYQKPMFKPFKELLTYLQKDLGLTLKDAVDMAKKVIVHGPMATKNFISAYKFASSKKGLKRSAKQAVKFALTMASQSNKEIKNDN
jgi:hypothetical protein